MDYKKIEHVVQDENKQLNKYAKHEIKTTNNTYKKINTSEHEKP